MSHPRLRNGLVGVFSGIIVTEDSHMDRSINTLPSENLPHYVVEPNSAIAVEIIPRILLVAPAPERRKLRLKIRYGRHV